MQRFLRLAVSASLLLGAPTASAHLWLQDPPARHPADDLKYGPCGLGTPDSRTTDPSKITTYQAGETITVTWTETVDHDPSHFRIMFSQEGDAFADPLGFDDVTTVYPELLDGIPDADGGSNQVYSVDVTLPNVACDTCTLQVIQVMHDKPPWGPEGGDDIYYQCADIVLVAGPDTPPDGAGGASVAPGAGGSAVIDPPGSGGTTLGEPGDGSGGDGEEENASSAAGPNCSTRDGRAPRSTSWLLLLLAGAAVFARRTTSERR